MKPEQRRLLKVILFTWLGLGLIQSATAQINLLDSLLYQGLQRKFMIHLPTGYSNQQSYPLVMNLHGGSGNMVTAQGFSLMNPVSDQEGFIVVWPQGAGIAPPGFSWADGRNTSADQAGIDDVGFLSLLLTRMEQRFRLDTTRLYMCGFSNGGFMTQRMACERPGRFAAMAGLGCSLDTVLYANCRPNKAVPMAFFNGTDDPAMPYYGGRLQNPAVLPVVPVDTAVQFWVRHNRCTTALPVNRLPDIFVTDSSTIEVYDYTNCSCNSSVKFYRILGGGHTWPGVYVASQAAVLGRTNRDINGSREVWNFFAQHTLCTATTSLPTGQTSDKVRLYPQPSRTVIRADHAELLNNYQLFNIQGHLIYSGKTFPTAGLDVSNLPGGIYLLKADQIVVRIVVG